MSVAENVVGAELEDEKREDEDAARARASVLDVIEVEKLHLNVFAKASLTTSMKVSETNLKVSRRQAVEDFLSSVIMNLGLSNVTNSGIDSVMNNVVNSEM